MIGLMLIGGYTLWEVIAAAKPDGELVNRAGRQRMLSQRVARLGLEVAVASGPQAGTVTRDALRQVTDVFEQNGSWLKANGVFDPEVSANVPAKADRLVHVARDLAEATPGESMSVARAVLAASDEFLPAMEQAVAEAERQATARLSAGEQRIVILLCASLVVLAAQVRFVYLPAQRRVRRGLDAEREVGLGSRRWALAEMGERRAVDAVRASLQKAVDRYAAAEKRAREEDDKRRDMEVRYDLAVNGTNDGFWDWDLRTNQLYFSPAYGRQLGYEQGELEASFEIWNEICHPDDLESTMAAMQAHLMDPSVAYRATFRLKHRFGGWRWMEAQGQAARNDKGELIRFAGSNRDVTDERERQRRLREQGRILGQFVTHTPAAVAMLDKHMCYLAVSNRWLTDYGLSGRFEADELVGQCHYDVFPDIPDRWKEHHKRVLAGEHLESDHDIFEREDGPDVHLRYKLHPFFNDDGSVGGMLMFTEVITERYEAEAAMARQQALLSAVLSAVPNMLYWKNAQGRYEGASEAMLKALNLNDPVELIGRTDAQTPLAASSEEFAAGEREAVAAGGKVVTSEHDVPLIGPDGSGAVRTWNASRIAISDAEGNTVGVVGVFEDVTERRLAEVELLDTNQRMFHLTGELEERGEQLTAIAAESDRLRKDALELKDRAEHASRAKGDFIADVSHEIRTPMAAIMGYAEGLATDDPAAARAAAQAIGRNGRHLLALLNDVLDASKLEAGMAKPELAPSDIRTIVEDVAVAMGDTCASKNIVFETKVDAEVPAAVRTDGRRLRQILFNLAGNAVKFTRQGSVKIDVAWKDERLDVAVTDTGVGVPADKLHLLFGRYDQADRTVERQFGGTGLGLSISLQLAELLGGSITVDSTHGVGSVFRVTLAAPAVDLVTAEPVRDAAPAATCPHTRVLLAEDNDDLRRLAMLMLKGSNFDITAASDGGEALELAQAANAANQPFGVALIDLHMPVYDGLEVCQRLRVMDPSMQFIALTAAGHQAAKQFAEVGCDTILTKPVDRSELRDAVTRKASAWHDANAAVRATVSAVEADEGNAAMAELSASYAAKFEQTAVDLRRAGSAGETAAVRKIAHDLKSAASFGFAAIGPIAGTAEAEADRLLAGELVDLREPVEALASALEASIVPTRRAA